MKFEATTVKAEEVWRSPDGQRILYEVLMNDENGEPVKFKTYSQTIATKDWTGTVESEERSGKRGPETFVKQPQKEGFSGGGRSFTPRDDTHIKAQWAIGQAIILEGSEAVTHLKDGLLETLAKELFAMVDRVKQTDTVHPAEKVSDDQLSIDMDDTLDDNGPETPVDLSTVDKVFGRNTAVVPLKGKDG